MGENDDQPQNCIEAKLMVLLPSFFLAFHSWEKLPGLHCLFAKCTSLTIKFASQIQINKRKVPRSRSKPRYCKQPPKGKMYVILSSPILG